MNKREENLLADDIPGALANFVTNFNLANVPPEVIHRAKMCLIDSFGIGLASVNFDFAKATAAGIHSIAGDGDFPVIGMDLKLPQRDAAHLNGTLIHGLDFDDTHGEAVVHTSSSAAPTMLIAGLANQASGKQALSAFIIASECAGRIGAGARGGFHEKGFHPTGVVGAFGCTFGAGYLAGLNQQQLRDAQGIVLSQAGGNMQFLDDGAWTKRNHPGWASFCAQTAVAMAKHGFFGPKNPYTGRFGLYPTHTKDGRELNLEKITTGLNESWEMMNIAFKPYPACHMTHAFADAILAVKQAHGLTVGDIKHITALVHEGEQTVICIPEENKLQPQNSYDAQFSVHYVIATTFLREKFGLAELEDDVISDPEILDLCSRISFADDPDSAYPGYFSGAIRVETTDGKIIEHREQINRGATENPLSDDDITNKFLGNATLTISADEAHALVDIVLNLEAQENLTTLANALTL